MKAGPDGKMPYTGVVDCAAKIFRAEGPLAFWTGFWAYCEWRRTLAGACKGGSDQLSHTMPYRRWPHGAPRHDHPHHARATQRRVQARFHHVRRDATRKRQRSSAEGAGSMPALGPARLRSDQNLLRSEPALWVFRETVRVLELERDSALNFCRRARQLPV